MARAHDDSGRRFTRRQVMASAGALGLGAGAAAFLARCGGPDTARPATSSSSSSRVPAASRCVLTPEQTEGPYYVKDSLVRSDITEDQKGAPLELRLTVEDAGTCRPIRDATVEVWHCNALGAYSGFTAAGAGGPAGSEPPPDRPRSGSAPPAGGPNDKSVYLRGAQRSDASGEVVFRTVYPGWYQGRTPHIHVKVHVAGQEVHTGQLYLDEAVTRAVYRRAPYASHGEPTTTNAADAIYANGGRQSTLALSSRRDGYFGRLTLGVKT